VNSCRQYQMVLKVAKAIYPVLALGEPEFTLRAGAMDIETYDIFSGRTDKQPLWIESVEGLDAAKQRMHDFAACTPGPYFVYRVSTQAVLAFTDTSEAGGAEE
jgi:hypothetical protein